jgi:aspartyl-tRNA synthetase
VTETSTTEVAGEKLEATSYRTHSCGVLRLFDERETVKLCGWVDTRRDHGGLIFVDLRDRTGLTQIVFSPDRNRDAFSAAETLRSEFVISITGVVSPRGADRINPKLPTGEIEVVASKLEILSHAETPPFQIEDDTPVNEDVRLKWRYIDLRRPRMQRILATRHRAVRAVRENLSAKGFIEVETPLLGKSTPEGARDYLVPVRLMPGTFYALPQSPQLYKQLLMIGGLDRYFQIAKCCRDEDLRADRQPEFTQIDVEMSFASLNDVAAVTEGLVAAAYRDAIGVELPIPFPRLTHAECMRKYGSDKPDLRFDLEIVDAAEFARAGALEPFTRALDEGGIVRALRGVGWAKYSRKDFDEFTRQVQLLGASGLGYTKVKAGAFDTGIAKHFPEAAQRRMVESLKATDGDVALFVAGKPKMVNACMSFLRNKIGDSQGWRAPGSFAFSWVIDFPLFAYDEQERRWVSEHHPFTSPNPEDIDKLESDPGSVRSHSYDLVLNGFEIASGSIRIHDPEMQTRMFRALGLSDDEIEQKFGFFRGALRYGAPPHAGIGLGVDRLVATMVDATSIREVIAFPKTQRGQDLLMGAPSVVDEKLLREIGVVPLAPNDGK